MKGQGLKSPLQKSNNTMKPPDIEALPCVAIVILNWNGRHFLQQFLPALVASTYGNKRIIVADNASTDDSIAYL
jgi:hypothetical protein